MWFCNKESGKNINYKIKLTQVILETRISQLIKSHCPIVKCNEHGLRK